MAWRAGRALKWGPDGKNYAIGDVVPVDVNDRNLWWLIRDGTTVVPESVEDLPPGASPYSFDPIIQASNRRIDRHLAKLEAATAPDVEPEPTLVGAPATEPAKAEHVTKKAPAKKATKSTTKKAAH